jgi:hypothetical protein
VPPVTVARLARARRQAETLAKMLASVDENLAAFDQEEQTRALTDPELLERDALRVRRQRIADSISEASSARPGA